MENEVGDRKKLSLKKRSLSEMKQGLVNFSLCSKKTQYGLQPLCAERNGQYSSLSVHLENTSKRVTGNKETSLNTNIKIVILIRSTD